MLVGEEGYPGRAGGEKAFFIGKNHAELKHSKIPGHMRRVGKPGPPFFTKSPVASLGPDRGEKRGPLRPRGKSGVKKGQPI